jgi:hypothetical protein
MILSFVGNETNKKSVPSTKNGAAGFNFKFKNNKFSNSQIFHLCQADVSDSIWIIWKYFCVKRLRQLKHEQSKYQF